MSCLRGRSGGGGPRCAPLPCGPVVAPHWDGRLRRKKTDSPLECLRLVEIRVVAGLGMITLVA